MRSSIMDRIRLLPSALLALVVSHVLADSVLEPRADNATVPAPISFTPDENWDGIDGSWSTFTLRIGSPQQVVRTIVGFNTYQTWAVLPQGCESAQDESACAESRGWLYNETASTTFDYIGLYELSTGSDLGYDGNAIFGYDTVGLGGPGEEGPTIKNTTVGGLAKEDFWLGVFGINPKPTNFSTMNAPSPSYMSYLKEGGYIASLSAGYTAGAQYQGTGVLASLTLGGYDESLFVANDVEFEFAVDNDRQLMVGVQSITTPSEIDSSPVATELLPNPIFASLDTTVSQIWLPLEACKAFEAVFGIVYDNDTDLYLVNDTLHRTLTESNPNITFFLAQELDGGAQAQITLPYNAFDLTAQPTYQGLLNQSYYFPLRRADNESQYTIGRTFFQEAYLTVNWESERFNVSQRLWNNNATSDIRTIPPGAAADNLTTSKRQGGGNGISAGAIAGIVVGVVALLAILVLLAIFLLRRKKKAAEQRAMNEKLDDHVDVEPTNVRAVEGPATNGREATVFPKAELEGSTPVAPSSDQSDSRGLLSAHGSGDPTTPGTMNAPSSVLFFGNGSESPTTPVAGEGTHSSTESSNGRQSVLSPLAVSEADSREREPVYEMAGDMPTIKEKDGRALSEKEALQHREKMYNGVETPPTSAVESSNGSSDGPRRVSPEEIATVSPFEDPGPQGRFMGLQHRAFSFEQARPEEGTDELYE